MDFLTYVVVLFMLKCSGGSALEDAKAGDQRYLKAYTEFLEAGATYEFLDYASDLSEQNMDDIIESICFKGFWMIYDDTDYDGFLTCSFKDVNRCRNLLESCGGMASSLRYAGSPSGLNDNYFNLYASENFVGSEFRGNIDVDFFPELDGDISSLIVTGQSGWTFYTGIEQTEAAVCVYPTLQETGDDGIFFTYSHYATMSELGLADNSIRSVARGCFSDRVVGAPLSNITLYKV